MVFEKYIVQLLDKYLSEYIENVDYKKLKLDVWSGNVELTNLYLKSNALADLHLPVVIKIGYLQKLTLQVPWKRLYTHPTKATITGLYIVIVPKIEMEYDAKQEEDDRYKAKMKEIDRIEQLHHEKEEQDPAKPTDDTFGDRMKFQIIKNLQLSIHNIHIVYEDRTTKPEHPFSFGITLNFMTFQTTNSEWQPTILKENTPINYKLGELNALSIYWNTDSQLNSNEIIKILQSKIAVDDQRLPLDMSYIFRPFNVQAKLIMTLKPRQQNFERPMFHITIDLHQMSLNLTRSQYLDILDFLEYQDNIKAKIKYIKYRPKRFQNSKEKWIFAYTAIVNELVKSRRDWYKWENIQVHLKYCKEYRAIYFQALMGKMKNEQKQRAEILERKLDVFNLTYIRHHAQLEAKKKKEKEPKTFPKALANWWSGKSKPAEPAFDLKKIMSDEEQAEFYQIIGDNGEDTSTSTYPKDYVDIDLTIRLMVLDLNIWSNVNNQQLQLIAQAILPNTEFTFRRRPATSSALFLLHLGSFQVFGCSNQPNEAPPLLIRSIISTNMKLLQVEFAINPSENDSGYRLQMISQSLEIKYHTPTIDKLVRCFRNDTPHYLKGVKQAASDMTYQSMVLLKQNVENAKVLDIYIDLQSSYFILPENGIYYDDCPVLCLDMGHLIFQQNRDNPIEHYTQYRLELKDFQLIYANHKENWQSARTDKHSRLHLVQPITLYANILKCLYTDRIEHPLWKMSGRIPDVNLRISDMRLFQIIQHLQSFSFPQTQTIDVPQTPIWTTPPTDITLETLAAITEEKSKNFTQFEGSFELSQINLLIEEAKNGQENPFLRLSFVSICAQVFLKTFSTEFRASLDDLIVLHEQFVTKNDDLLCLLAAQSNLQSKKLVIIHLLNTSSTNGKAETNVHIHLSKFVMILQLEALLSILRFQDNITEKWPKAQMAIEEKKMTDEKQESPVNSTALEIKVDLEEFRIVLTTLNAPMFDVSVQGIKAEIHRAIHQTTAHLILTDFCLLDPSTETHYHKIISQQIPDQELLSVSIILYNHPKMHTKALDDVDCDVKIHSTKVNMILIYKHINQLMEFIDILNISQGAIELASNQVDAVYEQVQKLQEQAFKLRLNAIFNAPTILIPINSTSDEGLFLDLGQLTLQTKFIDHPEKLLIEQQEVMIENVLASHVRMSKSNEIQSEIVLLECAKLQMDIDRLLYYQQVKTKAYISIKMQWDFVHFRMGKDDYLCLMKVWMDNFDDQTISNVNGEQYSYRQEQQKQEEDDLRKAVINKQTGWQIGERLEKIRIHAAIQNLALTIYLGESNLIERHVRHAENSKLANIAIEIFEIIVHQASDSSYKVLTRVKNFVCDDLRETHQTDTITRVIDRHRTVDPNAHMLFATLEYQPKNPTNDTNQRNINMRLESLYICLKMDYLMIIYEFFVEDLPSANSSNQISEGKNSTKTINSNSNNDVQTQVDMLIINPEILLLENQRQTITNCLVLNFGLTTSILSAGNTMQISAKMNQLAIFSSKYSEIRDSKMKYRILHPTKVDLNIVWDPNVSNITVRCSDILMNITPVAVRTVMAVMDSLNNDQMENSSEKFDVQTMFESKPFSEGRFWFLQEKDGKDTLKEKSPENAMRISEQFFLTLTTMEIKLDLDFGSETKSVAAMCLSNWTTNVNDWSNQMTLSSTMDIEAALYNEHTLAWEPFIEPILQKNSFGFSPFNVNFSIKPTHSTTQTGLEAKQLIALRTNDYLNITITKTGFDLLNYLLTVFGDSNKQNLSTSSDDQTALSLVNGTGRNILISDLHGLEFTENSLWTSTTLERNKSISLTVSLERLSLAHRLSVIEEQTSKNRQEFLLRINDTTKLISINRTWQRVYNLTTSPPIQILCDTQVHHNRRRVILSSIVKILNETTFPILILDLDCSSGQPHYRVESNEELYVPIDALAQTSSIFISVAEHDRNESSSDVLIFDWKTGQTQEEEIQMKSGQIVHFVIHKEMKEAYAENSDQFDRITYCIYIQSPIQLNNLLPIELQCVIQNREEISLQPNQRQLITSGNKSSVLQFIIPFCDQWQWISDPVHLKTTQKNDSNERIVMLRCRERSLGVVLESKRYHGALNLTVYTPFWLINHTHRKLEFQIGNQRMQFGDTDQTFMICPERYKSDANEKGQVRLDEQGINWSEKFSLDVIKSTGMASCKGPNDKTYMICVDIATSSFGLTKIITLSPAMVVVNQTAISLEIIEIVRNQEQGQWLKIEPDGGVIPFWPLNAKDSVMHVRYGHNRKISRAFSMNKQHQTLLYMNDRERLVIFVEVIATDFDGVRMIFTDYKAGDAPLLVVNHTKTQMVSFVQKDEKEVQYVLPQHYVFYTWFDPLKPREIMATCNEKPTKIELHPHRAALCENTLHETVEYVVFIDGLQTVLLIADNAQTIDMALNMPSSSQSICRRLQIGFPDVGLSMVNDRTREELMYITLNRSKVQWVEMRKSRRKPFPSDVQIRLEEIYQTQSNSRTKRSFPGYREVTFHGNTAELFTQKGVRKRAKRQSLYGLWIDYTWSTTKAALYACIYRAQIDNQLDDTSFPSMLYPVLPKTADSNLVDKSFIELSIYETKQAQSNIRHIQYSKLLIQEFALRIEQGLIVAILDFFKEEKNSMMSQIDMQKDLEYIDRSLQSLVKAQIDSPSNESPMYFDHIHLSPLKIHVSFSMHGSKSNEQLFAEYPLVGFLLKTLNVAEVQDVVLRLGFYQRSSNRYTITKLQNEVLSHYQNQLFKQIHVIILGLDVLGNPLAFIRGIAEGVESLFYEPYKGAIEGPIEFAEGVATGVLTLVGSTVGTTVGAISKITGVIGQSLATLTFDHEYQKSRIRRKETAGNPVTDIAVGGTNVVKGFVHGITGVVKKPIAGAKTGGVSGFVTGLGKGIVGAVAQPTGAIVDFASTSLDVIKRTATQEHIIRRIRYPRHIGHDGLVRPYISHEAMGVYILKRLKHGNRDTYIAHVRCINNPPTWLMATYRQFLYITEISFLDSYDVYWTIKYTDLQQTPTLLPTQQVIQILTQSNKNQPSGKLVKYCNIMEAQYFIDKLTNTLHLIGF